MAKTIEISGAPKKIKNTKGMLRFIELVNKKEIARRIEHCNYQTLISRIKLNTSLDNTFEQEAFAQEITELFDELFYEIGVMIGRVKPEENKKYKYLDVKSPTERIEKKVKQGTEVELAKIIKRMEDFTEEVKSIHKQQQDLH